MSQEHHTGDDDDDSPGDEERSSPTSVPLAVEDEASELEDGLFAESIIRSRSHYYRTNASSTQLPVLARSTSVQTQSSSSGPGAYAIPGMSSVPPPATVVRRAGTIAQADGSTITTTDVASLEAADRVPPDGDTSSEAVPPSPTPRLPKFTLRDGPSSSIYSIAPPTLTFSATTMTGCTIAPVAEEEREELAVAEETPETYPAYSQSPEMAIAPVREAPLSNFPTIEAFSAPVDSELFPVAVPFEEEDPKRHWCGWTKSPWIWMVSVATICIAVVVVVAGVCADGSCTQGTVTVPSPIVNYRELGLYDYINHISFATAKPISYINQSNPEEQALHWIVAEDPLQLSAPEDNRRIQQRYALLTLWYYNVEYNPWINITGWLEWEDECTWAGISCDNHVVTGLDHLATGTDGGIPPDLALLTDMQSLSINCQKNIAYWYSCLSGTVPSSLATLPRIRTIKFDSNNLTGPVSTWFGNWSNLEWIDISLNNFTGTLPADVMNSWTHLSLLDFSLNRLSGSLPEDAMAHWVDVDVVNFASNSLSGTLPEAIVAWINLTNVDFSGNQFVGTIPRGIEGNWTHLHEAVFFPNNFTGPIPNVTCMRYDAGPKVCNLNSSSQVRSRQ
jgi:hypothetical protein